MSNFSTSFAAGGRQVSSIHVYSPKVLPEQDCGWMEKQWTKQIFSAKPSRDLSRLIDLNLCPAIYYWKESRWWKLLNRYLTKQLVWMVGLQKICFCSPFTGGKNLQTCGIACWLMVMSPAGGARLGQADFVGSFDWEPKRLFTVWDHGWIRAWTNLFLAELGLWCSHVCRLC